MYQVALHASAPSWTEVSSSTSIITATPSSTNLGLDDHPGQGGAMLTLTDLDNISEDDFLISDLSEFSNEDIAAPIHSNASQANSDGPSFSTGLPKVKSCETMATISSNMNVSVYDNGSETLCSSIVDNISDSQQQKKDGSLINVLKCEDEGEFDWLSAFNEDTLIYGASRFGGTDSLLLSDSLPFGCEVTKHSQLHCAFEDSCKGDRNSGPSGSSNSGATDGTAGADVSAVPPLNVPTGKARSKRPRSGARTAGGIVNWSSAACILPWKQNSPTNSMDSTISDHLDDDDKLLHRKAMSSPSHFTSFSSHSTLVDSDEGLIQQQMSSSTSVKEGLSSDGYCKGNAYYGYSGESMKGKSMGKGMLHNNQKWKKNADLEDGDYEEQPVARRCTHCLSSKTPQWRAGPLGPKTLCNACGVRFKSGRLFDEYRPAKSPTFLSYKHSNSHKKVIEMRRRKGLQSAGPTPSSSNSSSLSHSSSSTSAAAAPNHPVKKLKIKLPCTSTTTPTQAPHLPDIALINTPTLESPNFIY